MRQTAAQRIKGKTDADSETDLYPFFLCRSGGSFIPPGGLWRYGGYDRVEIHMQKGSVK